MSMMSYIGICLFIQIRVFVNKSIEIVIQLEFIVDMALWSDSSGVGIHTVKLV